jgi:hypothetical protein
MTPEERAAAVNMIWYWLPVSWLVGAVRFTVTSIVVTEAGLDVMVSKNDAEPVAVSFADDELAGPGQLDPAAAKARVEAV